MALKETINSIFKDRFLLFLNLDIFIGGAVVMALEIMGSRLVAPYFGNSVYVWGSLIGVVMTSLSLGYYFGGKLADRKPNFEMFSILMLSSGLLILVIPFTYAPVFEAIIDASLGPIYGPIPAIFALFAVPSILLGMLSPFAIRLVAKEMEDVGSVSGRLYSISTAGSIVGTFGATFVFIPLLGVKEVIFALAIGLMLASVIGLKNWMKTLALIVIVASILPIGAALQSQNLPSGVIPVGHEWEILYEKETPYHHLIVIDDLTVGHRMLQLNDISHTVIDIDEPEKTVHEYSDIVHMALGLKQDIQKVLVIGGGGGIIPMKFHRDYPNMTIDSVEIDAEVTEAAKKYFGFKEDARLKSYTDDGRMYLERTTERYDLIILDAYGKNYVPFHLMTLEFFQEVKASLSDEGVIAYNLITSLSGEKSELFRHEYLTIAQTFSQLYLFPTIEWDATQYEERTNQTVDDHDGFKASKFALVQNLILLAQDSNYHIGKDAFVQRITDADYINITQKVTYAKRYLEDTVDITRVDVLTDDWAPVNTLLNPLSGETFTKTEV